MDTIILETLPGVLLESILEYLCFSDQCRFLACSPHLWAQKGDLESRIRTLTVENDQIAARLVTTALDTTDVLDITANPPPPLRRLRNMSQLQTLDVGPYGTDHFLECMATLFPQLLTLQMARSEGVTNAGLEWLAAHNRHTTTNGVSKLQVIDITFCNNTTYAGTFPLRDHLPHLQLLRRQPAWLDGKFHTPFNNNNAEDAVEVHTYWPDGTFCFSRNDQSNGFVASLEEWDFDKTDSDDDDNNNPEEEGEGDHHHHHHFYLGDKLQYNNFAPPWGWPEWARFAYRPGVCLLRLPPSNRTTNDDDTNNINNNNNHSDNGAVNDGDEGDNDDDVRTVLVGQYLRGLRAPRIPDLVHRLAPSIPVGQSWSVNEDGVRDGEGANLLISKMKVFPLDTMMPPKELVDACRRTCELMEERYGEAFLARREQEFHELFMATDGGN